MPDERDERIEAEIAAAWEQMERAQQEEADEYEEELCPCGHNHNQHYMAEGQCDVSFCGCPIFGEPTDNWETFTEVNLGGDPGGFKIYE